MEFSEVVWNNRFFRRIGSGLLSFGVFGFFWPVVERFGVSFGCGRFSLSWTSPEAELVKMEFVAKCDVFWPVQMQKTRSPVLVGNSGAARHSSADQKKGWRATTFRAELAPELSSDSCSCRTRAGIFSSLCSGQRFPRAGETHHRRSQGSLRETFCASRKRGPRETPVAFNTAQYRYCAWTPASASSRTGRDR